MPARCARLLAALGLWLTLACGRDQTTPAPRLARLEPWGRPVEPVNASGDVRPAFTPAPGQLYRWPAAAGRLVLSYAASPSADSACQLAVLTLSEGRETRWQEPVASSASHWQTRIVTLSGTGELRLQARPGDCGGDLASLHLAVPRLYSPARASARRRVLVWLSQDALRADHLSVYGYELPTSPRAEAWAAGAVVLEQASATASWTLPSLASQFTGRWPGSHGAVMNKLATTDATLWQALAAAGFTVLGSSANEFVSDRHGLGGGFDLLNSSERRARGQLRELLGHLGEWPGGDLALFVHLIDPHLPYDPPPAQRQRFDFGYRGRLTGDNHFHTRLPVGAEERRQLVALYDAEILAGDEEIGRFLDELRGRGLLESALIVYTSDHGEEFGEHGGFLHGRTLYQEALHVPLILAAPGLAPRRVTTPVSLVDLAPTVLDLLGLAPLPAAQGRSLRPLLEGRGAAPSPVFSETVLTADRSQLLALRLGQWKYIARLPRGARSSSPLEEQAYDLQADPGEQRDLLRGPSPADVAAQRRMLLDYLARSRAEASPTRTVLLDPETEAKLRAWGYIQ